MAMPRQNPAIAANASLRWKARTNSLINQQLKKINTTEAIIARAKHGKFNFGAFQLNGLAQGLKGATMGTRFGGPFVVGP